jgi:hypothetical protein
MDIMRIGIVLNRYRAEHGAYPESLDAVAERFPKGMPVDPFSGKGYAYSSDGKSCRAWSVHTPVGPDRGPIEWRGEW